jgi:hypothetical protein
MEVKSLGGKKKEYRAHVGHINYKTPTGQFERIDQTLVPVAGGWGFTKHNFQPTIPSFADGIAKFRDVYEGKDQTITYKAIAAHVAGVQATDASNPRFGTSGVRYPAAFGVGRDLWYYFSRSRLLKVATYENPNLAVADAVFEWEMTIPGTVRDIRNAAIDGTKDIDLKARGAIKVGQLDGTFLGAPEAWDSQGNPLQVQSSIVHRAGKLIFQKTIPLAELKKAIGTVYTDVVTSYWVGAGDGVMYKEDTTSWANIRGTSDATTAGHYTSDPYIYLTWGYLSLPANTYFARRGTFPSDTSGITDTDTIDSATFNYTHDVGIAGTVRGQLVALTATTQPPVVGDWDLCGDADRGTTASYAGDATKVLKTITINAAGLLEITKTGTTWFCLREGEKEFDNVAPTLGNQAYGKIFMSETANPDDPYLSITTSAAATATQTIIITWLKDFTGSLLQRAYALSFV